MVDFLILFRHWGHETGVTVSVGHLCHLMDRSGISYKVIHYMDDDSLLKIVKGEEASVFMLHIPSFQPSTLKMILSLGKEITLVLHSTIAFMQVEEEIFHRTMDFLSLKYDNWSICNPSESQIKGFLSYLPGPIFYLPNTYNPPLIELNEPNYEEITIKAKQTPKKISIFCTLRPFKNITTQVTALAIANKTIDLELHMMSPNSKERNINFNQVKRITDKVKFKTIWHPQCTNEELLETISKMFLGMQVSYTETFSYVLLEHMINGIPTIGSTAIPFASKTPFFNDPVALSDSICDIFSNEDVYFKYCQEAFKTANEIKIQNDIMALKTLKILLKRSNS